MLIHRPHRHGAVIVESAIVYVVLLLLVCGILFLGLTVFRYQQVAHAAREGARWASVHGAEYGKLPGKTAATADDVFNNAIVPHTGGMRPENVTYSVDWPNGNKPTRPVSVADKNAGHTILVTRANTVEVTVTFSWKVPIFGQLTVSGRSTNPMSF